MQVSGSLYGILIGSILAFTIADSLGLSRYHPSSFPCYFLYMVQFSLVFTFLYILINFHRATQRAYPFFYLIFDWSPSDSSSTQLRYHGGWSLFIWNWNWIGNGIFLSQLTLQTMRSCTLLHEAFCFVLKKMLGL